MIYGFDKEWLKIIGSHGAKVSSYAKIATEEKLKKTVGYKKKFNKHRHDRLYQSNNKCRLAYKAER
jgi:hypothetical protein